MWPESDQTLFNFYKKIQPGGPGWKKTIESAQSQNQEIVTDTKPWSVPSGILAMILAMILIYSSMFATGYWIYADYNYAIVLSIIAIIAGFLLSKMWSKIKASIFE